MTKPPHLEEVDALKRVAELLVPYLVFLLSEEHFVLQDPVTDVTFHAGGQTLTVHLDNKKGL